jgi:ADP-heptose:LPS heptosyltransferase
MTERAAEWSTARRILAVRLDSMGDVLMTTPALRAIRQTLPDAHLALLTSPSGAEVAHRVPELDDVIEYRAPWMKAPAEAASGQPVAALVGRLRRGHFDGAVIFTTFSQSPLPVALSAQLAGIPRTLAHVRENPYALVSDWVRDREWPTPQRHEVRRQLDLVGAVGFRTDDERLSYRVDPAASRRVRAMLSGLGIAPGDSFGVVHPGATASSRRYRPGGFADAAATLAREDGLRILVTGVEDECLLVERVTRAVPGAVPLAGRLSTDELAALIAISPLLITNNTGPAHLAAAVGTPAVVLYAQTNMQHTPWLGRSRVLTRDVPCHDCLKSVCPLGHHACLAPIEPGEIVAAARELMLERAAAWARRAARAEIAVGAHPAPQ